MPIPPIYQPLSPIQAACKPSSLPFTLQTMTDALNAADDQMLNNWITALQDRCGLQPVTLQAMIDAGRNTDDSHLNTFAQVFGLPAVTYATGLSKVALAQNAQDNCTTVRALAGFQSDVEAPTPTVSFKLVVDPTHRGSGFVFGEGPDSCVEVILILGEDVVSQISSTEDDIAYWTCNLPNGVQTLAFPTLVGANGLTLAPLFQLIVDKLSNLELCCNPCASTEQLIFSGLSGVGFSAFPIIGDTLGFKTLRWAITQEKAQGAADFSDPPRWKYGTFTSYDVNGAYSQPRFINYSGQRFYPIPTNEPMLGAGWHLEPGIVADLYGEPFPVWPGAVLFD